jgi:hypothetical protein
VVNTILPTALPGHSCTILNAGNSGGKKIKREEYSGAVLSLAAVVIGYWYGMGGVSYCVDF